MAITKHVDQIYIRATPEQVWRAITDPSWTRRYFHGTEFMSTLEPGAPPTGAWPSVTTTGWSTSTSPLPTRPAPAP